MNAKKHTADEEVADIQIDSEMAEDSGDTEAGNLSAALAKIKKLKVELEQCKAEKQSYLDGWQRIKADVANGKKNDAERLMREKSLAAAGIIGEILPILDGYDMARSGKEWNTVDATWRGGIEQIFNQLEQMVLRAGASRIGAMGEEFDPNKHEAVSSIPAETPAQAGTVAQVLRSGWQMGDRTIRPAQVIVAHSE